jgi:hypothetical protein
MSSFSQQEQKVELSKNWNRSHDPQFLREAIINVHEQMDKPGEERWARHSKYRERLYNQVVEEWCRLTGLEDELFPWNLDDVVKCHVDYRKCTGDKKIKLRA